MEIDIAKTLFPESGKLVKNEDGLIQMQIVDAELDPFTCAFNGDGLVEIDTSKAMYITLTLENLYQLIESIEEAELMANGIKASMVLSKIKEKSTNRSSIDIRIYNALHNATLKSDFYISEKTDEELMKFKNFGKKCLPRLKEILSEIKN
jgi:DNA-directed RNA polymerase alpha subunit